MKKVSFVNILFLVFSHCAAQNITLIGFLPSWNQTGKINKTLTYNFFTSTIFNLSDKTVNGTNYPACNMQIVVQPGVNYIVNPNLNLSTGYTYQRENPFRDIYTNEHRAWQQVILETGLSTGKLTNRLRFEQRFIENRVTVNYPLTMRLRYQLGYKIPLQGREIDKNEYYLNFYNEFFFSLSNSKNTILNENWFNFSIGYDFGQRGRMEFGYLLQSQIRNKEKQFRLLHLFHVAWITRFGK